MSMHKTRLTFRDAALRSRAFLGLTFALFAAGCGGGGEGGSTTGTVITFPAPAGLYIGKIEGNSKATNFSALILEDELWFIYGNTIAGTNISTGFLQGNVTLKTEDSSFSSNNIRDLGSSAWAVAKISGSYRFGEISGSIVQGSTTVGTFSGNNLIGNYSYSTPATVSSIVGSWNLAAGAETYAVSITSDGAVTVNSSGGCRSTGRIEPRPSGKNVFNISVRTANVGCALPATDYLGIAYSYRVSSDKTQIVVATVDASRLTGLLLFGQR